MHLLAKIVLYLSKCTEKPRLKKRKSVFGVKIITIFCSFQQTLSTLLRGNEFEETQVDKLLSQYKLFFSFAYYMTQTFPVRFSKKIS